ncbi:MAG: chromosomal replication initiator protein DnaA [Burkholderiales bacterium]
MDNFWQYCLDHFSSKLPPQQYKTWIQTLSAVRGGNTLTLTAPNRFVLHWIKERFLGSIEELAKANGLPQLEVVLALAQTTSVAAPAPGRATQAQPTVSATSRTNDPGKLNPLFNFDSFVPGKANQLARAAALQVAEHPGTSYNPLFIYGGVGLGKTHLIHAIGNHVLMRSPQAKIRYIHAEQYVSDVVRAYQHRAFDGFKKYYHSLDLLLIDDIQFIAGKVRTQEEFFYAFNALIESHRQLIITCDTYPKELVGVEDRLISRFGWGLNVAIDPPELEMRVAIVLKKAETDNIPLPQEVAFFIASHVHSNVRELEGALKRILAFAKFSGRTVDVAVAKEALRDLLAVQSRQVTVDNIQKVVAEYYKLKIADMHSKKRSRNLARPRQVAMTLAKELTQMSLPDIGDAFGGRDHTTVLHACRKVAELRHSDTGIQRDYQNLLQALRA